MKFFCLSFRSCKVFVLVGNSARIVLSKYQNNDSRKHSLDFFSHGLALQEFGTLTPSVQKYIGLSWVRPLDREFDSKDSQTSKINA